MKKIVLIFTVFLFLGVYLYANKSIVSGNAKSYAGDQLEIYTYTDFILKNKRILAKTVVDSSGNFRFEINTNETLCTFIDLHVFRGTLYIEPEREYKIVLPMRTFRDKADQVNPYFMMQEFNFRILNSDKYELNNAIKKFNKLYNNSLDILFTNFKGRISSKITEEKIKLINDSLSYINNVFFDNYKKYKFVMLRFTAYNKNKEKILNDYFSQNTVLYNNPSYNKTLSKIFKSYIFDLRLDSLEYFNEINISWQDINFMLSEKLQFIDNSFREYLLLINLHYSFYNNINSKQKFLEIIKSASQESEVKKHREIALRFFNKASKLITGNPAPDFLLESKNGDVFSLSSFSGNFIYLNFCSDNYPCSKDLDLLEDMNEKNTELLKIITIWKGNSIREMNNFIKKNNYKRTFLFCDENNQVLKDYEIGAYPTYFFIHPESKLLMISAPGPSDNFGVVYFKMLSDWKYELIRKKHQTKHKNPFIIGN